MTTSANCCGSVRPALHLHADLEGFAAVVGRLADRAGGNLHVLRAQRRHDLARRKVQPAARPGSIQTRMA
jgi:hypothetical protein